MAVLVAKQMQPTSSGRNCVIVALHYSCAQQGHYCDIHHTLLKLSEHLVHKLVCYQFNRSTDVCGQFVVLSASCVALSIERIGQSEQLATAAVCSKHLFEVHSSQCTAHA
eukprot:21459-Heterococcus_DN1.PRE.3